MQTGNKKLFKLYVLIAVFLASEWAQCSNPHDHDTELRRLAKTFTQGFDEETMKLAYLAMGLELKNMSDLSGKGEPMQCEFDADPHQFPFLTSQVPSPKPMLDPSAYDLYKMEKIESEPVKKKTSRVRLPSKNLDKGHVGKQLMKNNFNLTNVSQGAGLDNLGHKKTANNRSASSTPRECLLLKTIEHDDLLRLYNTDPTPVEIQGRKVRFSKSSSSNKTQNVQYMTTHSDAKGKLTGFSQDGGLGKQKAVDSGQYFIYDGKKVKDSSFQLRFVWK